MSHTYVPGARVSHMYQGLEGHIIMYVYAVRVCKSHTYEGVRITYVCNEDVPGLRG